jgi:MFS family permease
MTQKTNTNNHTGINRWLILAVICIPVFVGSLDLTVVSAFGPELILELEIPIQTGLDDAAWMVSAYLLAYTVSLTFMGRVSDLIGRKWVYAISLIIFIIGSVLVAVAHEWPTEILYKLYRRAGQRPDIAYVNLYAIIFGRVVQAFGAGALVPVSLALVGDLFPPEKRAQPMGLIGAVDTLGWVLGHLYGGIMVNIFHEHADDFVRFFDSIGLDWGAPDWKALFWINVPLTLFALFVTLWALRDAPMQKVKGRFDFLGAALIIAVLSSMSIGLGANVDVGSDTSFENLSQLPTYALPLVSLSVILLLLFIFVESRVRDPLINLKLFRKRNISSGLLANLFIGYCLFIGLVTIPILVNVRQESADDLSKAALEVGLMLSAMTVPMALAAVPGGWLSERIGYSKTIVSGLAISTLGFLLIWQTWHIDIDNFTIIIEMILVGTGIGLTFSPVSASVINAAGDDERGVASALVLILRLVGMTISVSSLTTISLNRVTALAAIELGDVMPSTALYINTYARISVEVLAELGLLGAVLCAVAMIPAMMIRDDVFIHGDEEAPELLPTVEEGV